MKLGSLSNNLLFLFVEKVIFTVVLFGVNIYLIRTLGIEEFGELAFFQLILMFLVPLGELGMRQVMISVNKQEYFIRLGFEMLRIKVLVSVILAISIVLLVNVEAIEERYYLLIVVIIFMPLDLCQYYFEKKLRNDVVVTVRLAVLLIINLLRVYLCYIGSDLDHIIISFVLEKPIQNLLLCLLFFIRAKKNDYSFAKINREDYFNERRSAIKRSAYFFMSMIFVQFNMRIDQILISTMLGEVVLAIYVVAYKFISPVFSAFDVVNNIALAHIIKYEKHDYKEQLRILYSLMILTVIPISIILYAASEYIVLIFVGEEYKKSIVILEVLSLLLPLLIINNIGGVYYSLFYLEKIALVKNFLAFIIIFAVNYTFINYLGFEGVIYAMAVNALVLAFLIELFIGNARLNSSIKLQSILNMGKTIVVIKNYLVLRLNIK